MQQRPKNIGADRDGGKRSKSIGKTIDSVETYPASEGFIAFQNEQQDNGLLMLLNHGIFYEFIKSEEFFKENPERITIADVEIGVKRAQERRAVRNKKRRKSRCTFMVIIFMIVNS